MEALGELGGAGFAGYDGDHAVPAWDEAIALRSSNPGARGQIAAMAMKAARMGAVRWGGFTTPMEPGVVDRYVDGASGCRTMRRGAGCWP